MKKRKIGLIGCGGRLRGVVTHLLEATDQVEIHAVCDPNPHSVAAARQAYGDDLAVVDSYRDLVANPELDWVMIGSWNCYHAEHVLAAFAAGKHVFCEKPLALTVEDCLAMRDAWQASGRMFSIGFTLRYSPHYRRIKELLTGGKIGSILSFEFNETLTPDHGGYIHADWRRKTEWAGSHLLEKCCHDLDIVNWMTGSLAVKAASFGGCDFFRSENAHLLDSGSQSSGEKTNFSGWNKETILGNVLNPFNDDKDIIDNQVAILQFASGARATFHTNCSTGIPERRLYICGTEGTLRADVLTGKIEVRRFGTESPVEDCSTEASGGHGGGDGVLGQSLADSMIHGTPPLTSLDDGLRAAFTAFGMDEAQRTGTVIDLMPLWQRAGLEQSLSPMR